MMTLTSRSSSALALLLATPLALTGCYPEKPYQRPDVPTAPAFRGAPTSAPQPETSPAAQPSAYQAAAKSLGDEQWWTVFGDKQLQELIRKGLAQNYDVKIAAERVLQAGAQANIAHSAQLPYLGGTGSFTSQQLAKGQMGSNPNPIDTNFGNLGVAAAWNLDFWGSFRNATAAARAQLAATEWARKAVLSTVVANIATGYFQLRTLDLQLEIARKTLDTRQESLQLTKALEAGGSGSLLDVREAEQMVLTVKAQITDLERLIEQQENTLCLLLGETPHPIARGLGLNEQPRLPEVPVGIPSGLLTRRPDIQQAESTLVAASAQINVARAAYFPSISLTGSTGTTSNALTRLFTGPSHVWNFGPSLSVPIFDAGRIRNGVRLSESEQRQTVLAYQQTIAAAFRDVSNALVAYRKFHEYREHQEQIETTAADALRLAKLRYEQGQSSYLEVLTNDRNYLGAQIDVATAKQNELLSLVQLYNALGGGWQ